MSRRRHLKRWLRSLVGQDVYVRRQITVPILTLGAGDGTWRVAPELIRADSIVYSFGIGRDLRFELDLIERFGVAVHAFDPTPIALAWVETQSLPPSLHVHALGIAAEDGTVRFSAPSKADWESFSMLRTAGVGDPVDAPVRRITTLMRELGHEGVDLVKMDIEGAEYAVIPDLLAAGVRPGQILIQFHHRWRETGPARTRAAIRLLQKSGYLIADVSPKGREITFVLRPTASPPTHPPAYRTAAAARRDRPAR